VQAINAGAKEVKPVADQFYGDHTGTLEDSFGHIWFLATHKEKPNTRSVLGCFLRKVTPN